MISYYGKYHAECWAEGKSVDEIQEEIQRVESMWTLKIANPFPGNAHQAYGRLVTLKNILIEKRLTLFPE